MKNFNNISDVLKFWGTKKPNKIFIIDGKKKYSFSEINHFVNSCCFFFKSLGLKERDIVSFNLKNSIEFVILIKVIFNIIFVYLEFFDTNNLIIDHFIY
mgnify:CR=1 FL=1